MALRPTPLLSVRRRNAWNERLASSDGTRLLLHSTKQRGNASRPGRSSSVNNERSIRSESEKHAVSEYGWQRFFGRGERGMKKYDPPDRWILSFWGNQNAEI